MFCKQGDLCKLKKGQHFGEIPFALNHDCWKSPITVRALQFCHCLAIHKDNWQIALNSAPQIKALCRELAYCRSKQKGKYDNDKLAVAVANRLKSKGLLQKHQQIRKSSLTSRTNNENLHKQLYEKFNASNSAQVREQTFSVKLDGD